MIFREATLADIPQMQLIRNAVKENRLSDPALVPDQDYDLFMNEKGNGWICEKNGQLVGFAIVDLQGHNIWALFLLPEFEGKCIGKKLHDIMMDWYFSQTKNTVWLGTAFDTRAEKFYRAAGWQEAGTNGPKEIKFEMSYNNWIEMKPQ